MQTTRTPHFPEPTLAAPFGDLDPDTLRTLALEAEIALSRHPRDSIDGAEIALTLAALDNALDAQDADFLAA